MTIQQIFDEIRIETNSNATKLDDAFLLSGVKIHDEELWLKAMRWAGDDSFSLTEAYTDLKDATNLTYGDIGYRGEYPFPCDLARPVRVEIDVRGTGDWKQVEYHDLGQNDGYSEVLADNPKYTVRFEKSAMHIRPLPQADVVGGLHIWYENRSPITSTSDTPIIDTYFHNLYVHHGIVRCARRWPEFNENAAKSEKVISEKEREMLYWYKNKNRRELRMMFTKRNPSI